MLKDLLLVRAAPTVPVEEVCQYLELNHAPLALSIPVVADHMKRYSFNVARDVLGRENALYESVPRLAAVVEHMLGGWEGLANISADSQYLEKVRPDESHMIANLMAGAPQFVAIDEEKAIFVSDCRTRVRIFDFLRRPSNVAREQFLDALNDDGEWAKEDADYRAIVSQRIHSVTGPSWAAAEGDAVSYDTDDEIFDAVVEIWIDGVFPRELLEEQRRRRARFCDPARSITAVTEEHRVRWAQ